MTDAQINELLKEREACSKTCLALIEGYRALIDRFKKMAVNTKSVPDEMWAEIAVRDDREVIRKARRGE
jgi:hypothetical protein